MTDFRVVIPARMASTRLPNKPLLEIAGRPMIAHVLDRARETAACEVVVATDDERIADAVRREGGEAMMTSASHVSGTDRLAEVATRRRWSDDTIVVNVQGDEPLLPGVLVTGLARALAESPIAAMATLATPIDRASDVWNPNVVKVVLDAEGLALYFSRAPIPWARGAFDMQAPPAPLPEGATFLRHIGLYAYRVGTLRALASAPQTELERLESLEQLRALSLGLRILVRVEHQAPAIGVDTPEDLERVRALLASR